VSSAHFTTPENPSEAFAMKSFSDCRMSALTFVAAAAILLFIFANNAAAQYTETILHDFDDNGVDGWPPQGNLIADANGNLYGVTIDGGAHGFGTVYELSPSSSGWNETILYNFSNNGDGGFPLAGLLLDSAGNLYGTTEVGGAHFNGTVYELSPTRGGWTYSTLYSFQVWPDGYFPLSSLIMDGSGALYGTTSRGGPDNFGTIFKLSPSSTGWTESILYAFTDGADGAWPRANLAMDPSGRLYGTATIGGSTNGSCASLGGCGVVFRLSPGGGWHFSTLYTFGFTRGAEPNGGLVLDASGNLYGTTTLGGPCTRKQSCGTVFRLSPTASGPWKLTVLYFFKGYADGAYPTSSLAMDAADNLFGTNTSAAFELSPGASGWTFSVLADFTGPNGRIPSGGLTLDASGNLYGATESSETNNGVAYELSPPLE
jgi:uncharacterized repeat protein (TIGR03803 family)